MKNLLQLHFYAEKEGKKHASLWVYILCGSVASSGQAKSILRFKSTYRRLFPTTLLRAFAPKGEWDFCPENEKNRLRCGQIDHDRAGFR